MLNQELGSRRDHSSRGTPNSVSMQILGGTNLTLISAIASIWINRVQACRMLESAQKQVIGQDALHQQQAIDLTS